MLTASCLTSQKELVSAVTHRELARLSRSDRPAAMSMLQRGVDVSRKRKGGPSTHGLDHMSRGDQLHEAKVAPPLSE